MILAPAAPADWSDRSANVVCAMAPRVSTERADHRHCWSHFSLRFLL